MEIPEFVNEVEDVWKTMFRVGGFPEPFLKGSELKYKQLANSYHSQVIRNDIRDEFAVKQIDTMETLYALVSECAGSPFSAANHARTLKTSPKTVASWLSVFEWFFLVFKLRPYSRRLPRSLVKEARVYLYDYGRVGDEGPRFENMVAVELNRAVTVWNDFGIGDYDLRYIRNKEKEEVDFIVTDDGNPLFMIEAKLTQTAISPYLKKFQNILNIPTIQLVNTPGIAGILKNGSNRILVASAANWLSGLS